MALTRITKGVIKPNEDYETRNVKATGIITSTELDVNGNADISGNLSVQGVLTYEDVTSIDSVGIITAKKDIHVGAGISAVGLSTFSNGVVVKTGTATTALIVEGNARVTGILTIGTGSLTITDRDINAVGVVTGSNFKTGTSNVHNVGIEVAQINVLGGPTKIGSGVTITHEGNFQSIGISTALQFKTGSTNVHNVGIEVDQLNVLGGATKIGAGLTITHEGNFLSSGISTAFQFKTGTSNLHNVGLEIAGINVLGADTPIGLGATVFNTGDIVSKSGAEFQGIVTATSFVGDGLNLTNTGSALSEPGSGTHRLVTTSLTSGTMTSSGTDSTLTFDFATHTLSATNISGNLNASQLSSGTIPIARLGSSGTKSGSTFLAGDNTFKTVTVAINSISGDGNDRLLTSDGDGTATAEANVKFDGSHFYLSQSNDQKIILQGSDSPYIRFRNSSGTEKAYLQYNSNGNIYLWNQNHNTGFLLGSNVQWYNGSSYQNVWHAGNDGSGSGLDADLWDGNQFSSYLNQALLTSSGPTFANVYNTGWFRSQDSGDGLYNTATGQHWYSDSAHYWNMGSGQSSGGIRFRDNHNGTIRGYVYYNNSNQCGFLDHNGNWSLRTTSEGLTSIGTNGYQIVNGNNSNNIYIKSGTTGSSGISLYNSNNDHIIQLYGETGGYYGFLDGNWAGWDIRKLKNGAFEVDEGSGLKRVLNEANFSSYASSSSILYIDVYGTGSTSDRNTANSWAQSAVSIPNDCLYIVRYYYSHSYWVGNHTGTSHEDRRTVFYKNSSGSTYWAGVDRS